MKQDEVIQMLKEVIDKADLMTEAERELDFLVADLRQENAALREVNAELLEALEDLAWFLGECGATEKARAVITKATGETK
jgi:hypothetical protein